MKIFKNLISAALLSSFLSMPAQALFLLDKEFVLFVPGGAKIKVQVSNLNGKVTRVWRDDKWVELPSGPQKYYQNLYELQKDRDKRALREYQKNYHKPQKV